MGNRESRETRRVLQISKQIRKRRGKNKELNVFMVGLDGMLLIPYNKKANSLHFFQQQNCNMIYKNIENKQELGNQQYYINT